MNKTLRTLTLSALLAVIAVSANAMQVSVPTAKNDSYKRTFNACDAINVSSDTSTEIGKVELFLQTLTTQSNQMLQNLGNTNVLNLDTDANTAKQSLASIRADYIKYLRNTVIASEHGQISQDVKGKPAAKSGNPLVLIGKLESVLPLIKRIEDDINTTASDRLLELNRLAKKALDDKVIADQKKLDDEAKEAKANKKIEEDRLAQEAEDKANASVFSPFTCAAHKVVTTVASYMPFAQETPVDPVTTTVVQTEVQPTVDAPAEDKNKEVVSNDNQNDDVQTDADDLAFTSRESSMKTGSAVTGNAVSGMLPSKNKVLLGSFLAYMAAMEILSRTGNIETAAPSQMLIDLAQSMPGFDWNAIKSFFSTNGTAVNGTDVNNTNVNGTDYSQANGAVQSYYEWLKNDATCDAFDAIQDMLAYVKQNPVVEPVLNQTVNQTVTNQTATNSWFANFVNNPSQEGGDGYPLALFKLALTPIAKLTN